MPSYLILIALMVTIAQLQTNEQVVPVTFWRKVATRACLSVHLSVCMSACPSVHLGLGLSVWPPVCLSVLHLFCFPVHLLGIAASTHASMVLDIHMVQI